MITENAVVAGLISYPVKGCAGVVLPAASLTVAGLAHDRTFMVVGPDGVFRSQRRDPRMATVRPEIDDGSVLRLHAPGADPVRMTVRFDGPRQPVTLFGTGYAGIDQGDAVARWLTGVLGAPSRLVRVPPDHDRITGGQTPGTSGYADSSPVLAVSAASLDGLNRRITERGGTPVSMDRFRPNIVVTGPSEPHWEDLAWRVGVADAELGFAKEAIRCVVTTVEQSTGVRNGPEPLRTLADYRRAAKGGVAFGAKFAVLRPGRIAVGDEFAVSAWQRVPVRS